MLKYQFFSVKKYPFVISQIYGYRKELPAKLIVAKL